MTETTKDFQIFAKPVSYRCNLGCAYCYYLEKESLYPSEPLPQMHDPLLEDYIRQHIEAHPGKTVQFSWHGGEPMLLGLETFKRIIRMQTRHCPPYKRIANGIQTNGTLIDGAWADFFADHNFSVGLSLDGPREIHDHYRVGKQGKGTHDAVMRGYAHLVQRGISVDILCVVNDHNVMYPLQVYRFFTGIGAKFLSFLPLVERTPEGVSQRTVHPEAFGAFLCAVFDQWLAKDIGTIKVQIFEEAARTAFGQDHSLCLFRPACGDIPVIEHNGDVYACDHFVEPSGWVGNIQLTPLSTLLNSAALTAFGAAKGNRLPRGCQSCEVLALCNGECPKNRFLVREGEDEKCNYLCSGYKLFFTHCLPFVRAIAQQWQNSLEKSGPAPAHTGRNQPCPCGSGRKLKKCCAGK